jgi:ribonuclease D
LPEASHPAPIPKPSTFIQDCEALTDCLKVLHAQASLAFDLEFDSHRHAYGTTLCLVQVATPDACFIIDPLARIDLQGLYEIFADERIEKIVHSPGEDLRLLHSLECYPKNLFDTEVVAKLLNYEQTSLSTMLQLKLGYSLDKGQQRSNWLKRPLSSEQIAYAAEDVNGLHALKQILVAEAEGKGLMPYVREEQDALSSTIYQSERKDFFLKIGDVSNLSPYDQYVLNELFIFRDDLARELNRPAYQVMDEGLLRDVASRAITPQDAPYARGIFGGFRNERFGQKLSAKLSTIHREAEQKELSHKRPPRKPLAGNRIDKEQLAEQREALFAPIQQGLAAHLGEHAARFILSNGTVTEVLRGNMKISDIKRQYKQELIKDNAQHLGIDLSPYL